MDAALTIRYTSGENAVAYALTTDSSGNLYAAGFGNYASLWIVRKYSSGSWSTTDDYQYPIYDEVASALSTDSAGNIYVAGNAHDSSGSVHWIVRKYSSGSWTTIDDYQYASGFYAQANALTVDSSGNVYAAGYGADSSGYDHWIVREYSSGSWTTIDDYNYSSEVYDEAYALTVDSLGNVYATGMGEDGSGIPHWIVRKYSSGSWTTIDDYQYTSGKGASAYALTVDSSGNVYAAGYGTAGSTLTHWIVRKYSSGAWTTIDDYQYDTLVLFDGAYALTADSSGNVYAAGSGYDSSYTMHWIVRKYSSGSWTTIDDYQYIAGENAAASALTMDSSGNVYAAGYGLDSSGVNHWIVREYSAGVWSGVQNYQLTSGLPSSATGLTYVSSSHTVLACGKANDALGDQFWTIQTVP